MRSQLCGRVFRKTSESCLRTRIGEDKGRAAMSGTRTDVNDGAARPPLLQVARERLREQKPVRESSGESGSLTSRRWRVIFARWSRRRLDISRHHLVPQFWSRGLEVAAREARRRRVDEEVDRAELCDGCIHDFLCRRLAVREIDGYEGPRADLTRRDSRWTMSGYYFACDSVQGLPATRGIPPRDENASRARSGAGDSNAPAQATRASGDNDSLAL
ncbi:unnamed protein product [Pelagomonas calceolata]|uniref:Uncharacterized protein n=1 Tax=Pelagomonas calceolata TaxID=35677 RepID=A0A8J2SXM2_9STRA|nr:unnamed protein product [Pelagomonas calceolata]